MSEVGEQPQYSALVTAIPPDHQLLQPGDQDDAIR